MDPPLVSRPIKFEEREGRGAREDVNDAPSRIADTGGTGVPDLDPAPTLMFIAVAVTGVVTDPIGGMPRPEPGRRYTVEFGREP